MAAKAMAEAANRSKSAFLAITSHELRTPLTSIIGFCDLLLLEHGDEPGDLSQHLKLISESSRSLLRIINDILDLSKIEAKTLEIKVEPVDPDRVLDLLSDLWQQRASMRQLKLVRHPSVGRPRPFYSDPLRLRQVLDNLLNNAVKFTPKGTVEMSLEHHEEDLVFSVTDSGTGIPASEQHHLFQPFWQMADATTRREGGTGLGLYICRQIAMLLGGTIWLARSDATGTQFKLRLPRNLEGQTGLHRTFTTSVFKTPPPMARPG
jgi:signal transduction histidine kinase